MVFAGHIETTNNINTHSCLLLVSVWRTNAAYSTNGFDLNKNAVAPSATAKERLNELSLSNRRVYRRSIEDKTAHADV
jgi:hypothetical protein